MRKIYFKLFITIVVVLCIIYLIQQTLFKQNEGFTPRIRSMYRPYVRLVNQQVDTLLNNYGMETIFTKLRKWNIY